MKNAILILMIGVGLALASCQREQLKGSLRVALTDAPGDFQQVNVEVLGVEVHYASSVNSNGGSWVALTTQQGIYDLLLLQDGVTTMVAPEQYIPSGKITQIRLLLGSQNSVMVDDESFALTVPSGEESGLKVNIDEEIAPDTPAYILLDFDAAESVRQEGDGVYSLRPVIKALQ